MVPNAARAAQNPASQRGDGAEGLGSEAALLAGGGNFVD
jgi:hypothetical protein